MKNKKEIFAVVRKIKIGTEITDNNWTDKFEEGMAPKINLRIKISASDYKNWYQDYDTGYMFHKSWLIF